MHDLLPESFCWSRFGPEAGESFERILARKEAEREACGGTFYWGIGSAIAPALTSLIADVGDPEVLFSPIRSAPRAVDVSPSHVVRWHSGRGLFGEHVELPEGARVTSRWNPQRPSTRRYALVCASESPLAVGHHGELSFPRMRNLRSGAPVGASQVTAVVRQPAKRGCSIEEPTYPVALRVSLVWPFLIHLSEPASVGRSPELARDSPVQLAL